MKKMSYTSDLPNGGNWLSDTISTLETKGFMAVLETANTLKDPVSSMTSAIDNWKGNIATMPDILREMTYPTPLTISPLLPLLLLSLARQKHTPNTKTCFKSEYDYIVVGAGSAGSVVASRLSEEKSVTVLLLEAGKSPPLQSEVPSNAYFFLGSDMVWKFKSEPQKHAAGANVNRQVSYMKGKTVGGSSVMNAMLYIRGHKQNYDDWAADGATGWSWDDVFPYFLKAEGNVEPEFANNGYHNSSGPLTVQKCEIDPAFDGVPPAIAADLGYQRCPDISGPSQIGITTPLGNLRDNQRCSTAKAYLVPAENRKNLDIVAEAFVTKILIKGNTAEGVEFDFQGSRHCVRARREVILSAGAINTPKLLMLSGIGPRETLEDLGVQVKAALPVGKNLQDHPETIVDFVVNCTAPRRLIQLLEPSSTLQYIKHRSGPLAQPAGIFATGFFTNDERHSQEEVPENEVHLFMGVQEILGGIANLKPEANAALYGHYLRNTMIHCLAVCVGPRSRGHVTIRSTDPYENPIIEPNYFSDPRDLEEVVSVIKMCLKISQTPAMQKFGIKKSESVLPGCEKFAKCEDQTEYLRCYARNYIFSSCHDAGTAKMGDPCDNTTVVDPELRVKGINGLRVVDASIIPILPTGNPNNPVIMIAEKAADMIKKTIHCKRSCSSAPHCCGQ